MEIIEERDRKYERWVKEIREDMNKRDREYREEITKMIDGRVFFILEMKQKSLELIN
ncbi:MAG: hypothetical protein ABIL89_03190 [candidate division WOR-3 bacterium]